MTLHRLTIQSFRNIDDLTAYCSPHFNVIVGPNGAGKTSFLEAIYYLAIARSFRKSSQLQVIQNDKSAACLYASLNPKGYIGIERSRNGKLRMRVNEETVYSKAELTRHLPLQLINPDGYRLLEDGPEYRRRFVDWGVFHVEHTFLDQWRRFQKLLKQRNAALKNPSISYKAVQHWDDMFVEVSHSLTQLRRDYVEQLEAILQEFAKTFDFFTNLKLVYKQGWKDDLENKLFQDFKRDCQFGCTLNGPHRADLVIYVQNKPAVEYLSRGQQKTLVTLLKLAQGALYQKRQAQSCIYLFDDLASELDVDNRAKAIDALKALKSQVFMTSIQPEIITEHFELADNVAAFLVGKGMR